MRANGLFIGSMSRLSSARIVCGCPLGARVPTATARAGLRPSGSGAAAGGLRAGGAAAHQDVECEPEGHVRAQPQRYLPLVLEFSDDDILLESDRQGLRALDRLPLVLLELAVDLEVGEMVGGARVPG